VVFRGGEVVDSIWGFTYGNLNEVLGCVVFIPA
jgi:hypothetical protein